MFYKRIMRVLCVRERCDIGEIKEKNVKMGWMNSIPYVDCHMLEARTVVVEQEGWEISILSQLRTELMCHLAYLNYRANHSTVVCGNGIA